MKVLLTNWINLLGVFLVVLIYAAILNITDIDVTRNMFQAVVAALILVCLYGIMFWGLFIVLLVFLDLLLIVNNKKRTWIRLLTEWALISIPFLYWAIEYKEWIFLSAIGAFLITQLLREKQLAKLDNPKKN